MRAAEHSAVEHTRAVMALQGLVDAVDALDTARAMPNDDVFVEAVMANARAMHSARELLASYQAPSKNVAELQFPLQLQQQAGRQVPGIPPDADLPARRSSSNDEGGAR